MKITKAKLKQIIKEEIEKLLEATPRGSWHHAGGPANIGGYEDKDTARASSGGSSYGLARGGDAEAGEKERCRKKGMKYNAYLEKCVDRNRVFEEGCGDEDMIEESEDTNEEK